MKNNICVLSLLILIVVSCSKISEINIIINNADGLEKGADVVCMGKKVGKVVDIRLIERQLHTKLKLYKGFVIPKGSEISLVSLDILGTKAISIALSKSDEYYSKNDTLICINKAGTKLDTILMRINSAIEEVKDSLLRE